MGEYEDAYLSVNNDPIIWTMLNAIKELKAENDALKQSHDKTSTQLSQTNAELESLRAKVARFEFALQKLEALVAVKENADVSATKE